MTTSTIDTVEDRRTDRQTALQKERLFYLVAACISVVIAIAGFRNFYFGGHGFGGNPLTPQIVPVIYVHAFVMTSWVILFVTQNYLVYTGRLQYHRTLGRIGGFLAIAVVGMSTTIAILSAHYNTEAYAMFGGNRFFLIEMLTEAVLIGVLVAIGIYNRARAEIHRPVMLMAFVVFMSGALARCPLIDFVAATGPFYAYAPVILFGLLLLGIHWAITRTFNYWFAVSLGSVALIFLISMPIGKSAFWQNLVGGYIPYN
jgi:uncharacterized membrane protein YiaA